MHNGGLNNGFTELDTICMVGTFHPDINRTVEHVTVTRWYKAFDGVQYVPTRIPACRKRSNTLNYKTCSALKTVQDAHIEDV